MKLRRLSTALLLMAAMVSWAQAPHETGTYYQKANGKKGRELKTAMYQIINTPSVMDYDSLWTAYRYSDAIPTDTVPIIWDMYSCKSAYSIYTNLHRNGSASDPEGVKGFQREHSMPKSWFNPEDKTTGNNPKLTYKDIWPMFSDLTHLIPAEGKVNVKRSNNPYGTNNGGIYSSEEGFSKLGACTYVPSDPSITPFTGKCFEPNDMYKGDLARIYFYMVTAYEKKQPTWSSTGDGIGDHCGTWTGDMFNLESDDAYQPFAPWALEMLMQWSKNDPVSQKEIDRNEAVYKMQGNRNPFVDYPGLEDYIWGEKKDVAFDYGGELPEVEPTSDNCEVALNKTTFGVDWHPSEAYKEELTNAGKDWTLYDNLREYFDRTPLTVTQNHVDITLNYGIYGRYLYADADLIRMYNYNTLKFNAHNNKITKIEFTLGESNHADKKLKAFVGTLNDNVWTGEEDEVLFTSEYVQSKYNSGTKTTTNYYLSLTNVKVTVANPSGIEQMKAQRYDDDRIYNLMGVQMNASDLVPGIYIKNGRKFVVK